LLPADSFLKLASILLALLGLALLTGLSAWLGAGAVLQSVLSVGWPGFLLLVAVQAATDLVLATAWRVACPEIGWPVLLRARLVREAAGTCLPFSQLGSILLSIRATLGRRRDGQALAWAEGSAANVVDLTTEVLGQILFVLLGLLFLLDRAPSNSLVGPVGIGMALLALGMAGFIAAQRRAGGLLRRVLRLFGDRVSGPWRSSLQGGVDQLQKGLDRFYGRPGRIALAALVHLLAWLMSGVWVWLAYRFLGAPIELGAAVAIEGVASGVLAAGFLVPAALGVQEAAYVALGSLFGLDPHLSFGLSLLRRGRDLVLGVPVLLAWQALELRRLRRVPAEHRLEETGTS